MHDPFELLPLAAELIIMAMIAILIEYGLIVGIKITD
jgi:hypothetical protein